MRLLYALAITSNVLIVPFTYSKIDSFEKALEALEHLETYTAEENAAQLFLSTELQDYLLQDSSLTPEECELLLERITSTLSEASIRSSKTGECAASTFKDVLYRSVLVKYQLLAKNLTVCNNTKLNNLTVDGSFDICGVPGCNLVQAYALLLTATSADIPHTLVLRDASGNFTATTITVTGGVELRASNDQSITLSPSPLTNTYVLELPPDAGTFGYALTTDGSGVTSWQPVAAIGATGIVMLNGLTTSTQFFANGFAGIQPQFTSVINTHTLNIPLASTYGVLAGLITSTDYYNFSNTYTTLVAGTPLDIPNTLVKRDAIGSFAATNVSLQAANSNQVALAPNPTTNNYILQLPANTGTSGYFLSTDGTGVTSWQAVSTPSGGITTLNGLTTSTQFFANGFAGIQPQFNSAINTHTLNIPLASTYGVLAGLITSTNYYNFSNTYTTLVAGTPLDIPNTLVKRDATGSFSATNVSLQAANSNQVALAPNPTTNNYTLQLPANTGTSGYFLSTDGTGVTSWQAVSTPSGGITTLNGLTTSTQFFANGFAGIQPQFNSAINTHTLNIPLASTYGVLAGLITSTDYYNFSNTYTTLAAGTPLNIPNTLVKRDNAGSFAAQNVSAQNVLLPTTTSAVGQLQINSVPFLHSFGTNDTFLGASAGNFTLTGQGGNTAIGANALSAVTTGQDNTAIGVAALSTLTTASSAISIGNSSNANVFGAIAIGKNTTASSLGSVAIGNSASATTIAGGIAIGNGASSTNGGTVMGRAATSAFTATVVIGAGASASGITSVIIGDSANSTSSASSSIVIGSGASASASAATVIGVNASSAAGSTIAIGGSALIQAGSTNSVVIGSGALTAGSGTVVIGASASNPAGNTNSVGIGTSVALRTNCVIIGANATTRDASGVNAVVVGTSAQGCASGVTIGQSSSTNNLTGQTDAIAIGSSSSVTGARSIGIGSLSTIATASSVALGYSSRAFTAGTAMGYITTATTRAVAIGFQASAQAFGSIMIGGIANTQTGVQSTIIGGNQNTSTGFNSYAFGQNASASNNFSFVWTDSAVSTYSSHADNSFNIRAAGGAYFDSNVTITGAVFTPAINGATVTGSAVLVDSTTGQLGTVPSARRYKKNIQPMDATYSAPILELQPVTFNYKESPLIESIGLIAEDVETVFPSLVLRNVEGEVETVKYHELPVLLLNELKKQQLQCAQMKLAIQELNEKYRELKNEFALLHPYS